MNYLKGQLYQLDPNLAKLTGALPSEDEPPIVPSQADPNLTETYLYQGTPQPPQFMQNLSSTVNKALTAMDPITGIPAILGSLPGPQKFAQAHPQLSDLLSAAFQGLAGSAGGSASEAGMNKLPMSVLMDMAQRDTARAYAPPDINDVINARADVYHVTPHVEDILNSGEIKPGSGQGFQGVSTSRIPAIRGKSGQIRFVIDPDAVPSLTPTADSGYQKTFSPYSQYKTVLDNLSGPQAKEIYSEAGVDPAKVNYTTNEMGEIYSSNAFQKAYKEYTGNKPNPDYEFESRTKGAPININDAVKELLTTGSPTDAWYKSLESNNPVPVRAIAAKLLPYYKALKTKELSQQILGQKPSNPRISTVDPDLPTANFKLSGKSSSLEQNPINFSEQDKLDYPELYKFLTNK